MGGGGMIVVLLIQYCSARNRMLSNEESAFVILSGAKNLSTDRA